MATKSQETEPEHPAVTVADKLGKKVAEHVTAARKAGAADEAAAKQAALGSLMTEMYKTTGPAVREALGPIMESLPDEHPLRKLLEAVQSPESEIIAVMLDAVGFIGLVMAIIPALGRVLVQPILNQFWAEHTALPMSPAQAAQAAVQNAPWLWPGNVNWGQWASASGIDEQVFETMVYTTGNAPSPQDLFQAFRRDLLDIAGVQQGLREGNTKDAYVDLMSKLVYTWPSPDLFVNAAVREQFPTKADAEAWAAKAGLDVTTQTEIGSFFDVMFDVAGRPPGPGEAAHMTLRGIIPRSGTGPTATSFQQAIAESDVKTKWTDALWQLYQYVPPPETVKGLYLHGAIDHEQAVTYMGMAGVGPDLANSILYLATQEYIAQDKALAKGEILTLYTQGSISYETALEQLAVIGFRGSVGEWLLELSNVKREQQILNRQLQQISQQVVTGIIEPDGAAATLAGMGVPAEEITWLRGEWQWSMVLQHKRLTPSQIAKGFQYGAMSWDVAIAYLRNQGYTEYDASVLLSGTAEVPPVVQYPPPPLPKPLPARDAEGKLIYPHAIPGVHSQPEPPAPWPPAPPTIVPPPAPFTPEP